MFVLATLLYPCVLALLCAGAGLLVDRASGSFLPGVLLPAVGAATLIGALPAHDLRRLRRAGDALSAGAARPRRLRARAAAAGAQSARPGDGEAIRLAAGRAGDRLRRRAGAGPVRGAPLVLLVRRPHRLGLPHARGRLPDPPRPGLLAPGPAQLARPVPQRLLQHLLPLGRGHAVRRQRVARARAPDLGLPAVQRVHARLWPPARRGCSCGGSASTAGSRPWRR